MREIKFRGKRCDNGEWVYGFYVESKRSWSGGHPHKSWIINSPFTNGGWFALQGRSAVVDNTIGQYTGLNDKNGVEIYEGDIIDVRFNYGGDKSQFYVHWNDEKARFEYINCSTHFILPQDPIEVEVMSNIYDNPTFIEHIKYMFEIQKGGKE